MMGSKISAKTPLSNENGFSLSTSRTTTGSLSTMNTLGPNASLNTPPYRRKYGYSAKNIGPPTKSSMTPSHTGAYLYSRPPHACKICVTHSETMSWNLSSSGLKSSDGMVSSSRSNLGARRRARERARWRARADPHRARAVAQTRARRRAREVSHRLASDGRGRGENSHRSFGRSFLGSLAVDADAARWGLTVTCVNARHRETREDASRAPWTCARERTARERGGRRRPRWTASNDARERPTRCRREE